jgi:uncharacterized OB-fold protein
MGGRAIRGEACISGAVERAGLRPQVKARVLIDECVTMLANIVDRDLDGLRIGSRMRLIFKPAAGAAQVPIFRPALPSRPAGGDA